jgi:hypothetical protein
VRDCGELRGEKHRGQCSKRRLWMHKQAMGPLWALKAVKNERRAEARSATDKSGKTRVGANRIVWDSYALLTQIQGSQNAIVLKW